MIVIRLKEPRTESGASGLPRDLSICPRGRRGRRKLEHAVGGRQIRDRKEAIERQNEERREEQTELMARLAIENANRSKILEADALERQAKERALAA